MRLIRVRIRDAAAPVAASPGRLLPFRGLQRSGHRGMTEEVISPPPVNSPESDCNSNHAVDKHIETTGSYVSNASSQDVDFVQDNSDYQWFLDYGYRDGSAAPHHHVSVLSSLATSHACDDPTYYEDMARNLDANLAEVDMEDFRTEDIHSILTTLPAMCCEDLQTERQGEMFASVSGSMMAKFDFDSSISPHSSSQAEDSAGSTDTMSICKSELLFSPVKECPLPNTNFSVDSLDCDLLTEHDIMLTCQANKDNYTIAFEGSITLYSEDSDYHEAGTSENETASSENNNWPHNRHLMRPGIRCGKNRALDTSMARSDSVYTTWSKLKKRSSEVQLTRHPSGNNNTCPDSLSSFAVQQASALKSQSLPNLYRQRRRCFLASLTNKLSSAMSSSAESESRLPHAGGCVKLYDVQHNSNSLLSAHSETNSSVDGGTSSCSGSARKQSQQHNFSLVKLFMKQKSMSNEGMCYAMDQSSASECWPTSNNSQSEGESDSCGQDCLRQRHCQIPNIVQHIEGNYENKACCSLNDCNCAETTACENDNNTKVKETLSRYSIEYTSDNGNNQKTNTVVTALDEATNNWIRPEEVTTDYSTCCFEDSLVEPCRKDELAINQRQELIVEEDEPSSEHSESVEQLSESVSKIEESTLDLVASSCISDHHFLLSSQTNAYKIPKPKCNVIDIASVPKTVSKFNVNNNNSIEDVQSPIKRRQGRGQSQGTQTKRLSSFGNSPSPSSGGDSISSCSSSAETDSTKVQRLSPTRAVTTTTSRHVATQIPVHLMSRSIQTSGFSDVTTLKSAPFQLLENPNGTSLVKVIEPTVKPNLGVGKLLGDNIKKPVYVFYPNYTLPDLAFLRDKRKELDVAEVLLMPQKFTPTNNAPNSGSDEAMNSHQKTSKSKITVGKSRRPFSCTDVEALKKRGFSHVRDWDSLTFLLPKEYRQILAEVPEIVPHLKGKEADTVRPLFCVSPPLRKTRPSSCDCTSLLMTADGKTNPNISSSSSTATQPSSGYRGSSTILSDSSSNHANPGSNYNPLFVYRYDSVSSESSMMSNQQQGKISAVPPLPKRSISLPNGGEIKKSPPVPLKRMDSINTETPPRPPLPRSILRKSLDNGNGRYNCKVHKNNANSKRYSMFELGGDKSSEFHYDNEEKSYLAQRKRRSLQEVDYSNLVGSPKKAGEVSKKSNDNNIARRLSPRLHPEKDIDELEDEDYDDEGVDAGTDSSFEDCHHGYQVRPPTPPIPKTPDSDGHCCLGSTKTSPTSNTPCKNNEEQVLKLEEFLHLSGLSVLCSGENLEDWDETEMQKLKLKVSKFLLSKQKMESEIGGEEGCRTPNNTPEHHSACDCTRTKKSVSFAEKVCVHERDLETDRTRLLTPPNSPNVAAMNTVSKPYQCKMNIPLVDMPIREEGESSPDGIVTPPSDCSRVAFVPPVNIAPRPMSVDLSQKRVLVTAVSDAVEQMICHFSAAENQTHCTMLGDSSHTPACAHLALNKLCPALYAVLSDGLRPSLDTAFGSIHNSVWQVVEASAQQGLMTKALNDLVLRINSEDVLTEGLMKFNAFVFGLLNVRSLDAWVGYLRTRESVLRKHYTGDGLLVLANTAGASVRALTDQLLASLQPLALLPFRLDLLFECRQLHLSLRRVGSLQQPSPPEAPQASAGSPSTGKQWTLRKLVRSIQSSLTQSTDEEHGAWYQRSKPSAETLLRKALSDEDAAHHPNCSGNSPEAPLPDLLDSSTKLWPDEQKQRPRSCVDATSNGAQGGTGSFSLMTDIASTVKKRWSGIHLGSKLFQAFDRLAAEDTEEEYTDSLENTPRLNVPKQKQASSSSNTSDEYPEVINKDSCAPPVPQKPTEEKKTDENAKTTESDNKSAMTGGGKFRRLQMKWEMLSGKEATGKVSPGPSPTSPHKSPDSNNSSVSSSGRSKIPRPVTSPVRASGIPVLSPQAGRTNMKKAALTSPMPTNSPLQLRKPTPVSNKFRSSPSSLKDALDSPTTPTAGVLKRPSTRPSRVDQVQDSCNTPAVRPSSLPYRPPQGLKGPQSRRPELQRRAASSSLNRQKNQRDSHSPARFVRTLCHRLPSDSGHLSFNDGERLRLVLEVDDKWLLCCRGDQKGLVPRSAVIMASEHGPRF
ncbi:serine-rich adhesin for platelets [Anabrus simplex]|uniref:serine-rich adhesin for platelets n=1 Tax=Anabrus simplex TaxID=316456 RepID=UPI0035A3512A